MGHTVDAIGYKADVPARAKESIAGRVQGVKEKLVGTGQQVSDAAQGAGSQLSGVGSSIAEAAPDRDDLRQAGHQAVGLAQSNPLGLAIGAAALGFLAGLAIPATPVENERIGPVSDEFKRQALETGHDAIEHGRQVVAETVEVAQERAQDLASDVAEAAQDTLQTVREEARENAQTVAQEAQDAAQDVRSTAQSSAQEHAGDLQDTARENAAAVQGSAGSSGTP